MLLALDTSTRQAGIALYDGERGVIAEYNWLSGRQHTVELMPEVARLLVAAHATPRDLQATAVALGPGSFTGLRVALAAAKGLALSRGTALLGISTLDVVAYPHHNQPLPVAAAVQAGRGRLCWAVYRHGPQGWPSGVPFALTSAAEMAERLAAAAVSQPAAAGKFSGDETALAHPSDGRILLAGEFSEPDRATLTGRLGGRAHLLPLSLAMRRAGCLAEIAWARFAAGEYDDPVVLSPIYMGEPVTFARPVE